MPSWQRSKPTARETFLAIFPLFRRILKHRTRFLARRQRFCPSAHVLESRADTSRGLPFRLYAAGFSLRLLKSREVANQECRRSPRGSRQDDDRCLQRATLRTRIRISDLERQRGATSNIARRARLHLTGSFCRIPAHFLFGQPSFSLSLSLSLCVCVM